MTLMCESYGADMRLVAFMQYMRVLGCVASASLVAMYLGVPSSMHSAFEFPELASWVAAIPAIIVAYIASGSRGQVQLPRRRHSAAHGRRDHHQIFPTDLSCSSLAGASP